MESLFNTYNYLVLDNYLKDSVDCETFKEVLKFVFTNTDHKPYEMYVGIYKDNQNVVHKLSREMIIEKIISKNYTSKYVDSVTIWKE